MKISMRLVLMFILAAVLPLALFSYFNLQQDEATQRQEVLHQMSDLADKKVSQVRSYLAERKQDVGFLARAPVVLAGIEPLSRQYAPGDRTSAAYSREDGKLREYFTRYSEESRLFYDMFLIDPQGKVVYSQKHESDWGANLISGHLRDSQLATVFRETRMTLEPVFSGYEYYAPSQMAALFIAAPILIDGKFKGVFAVQLDNALFYRVATDATGLGMSGEAAFAQWDGEDVWYTTPLKYRTDAAMHLRIGKQEAKPIPIFSALSGNSGEGVKPDYRGTQVVAAWRYLPELDWGMVVKIDADEVFAPIYRQRTLMQEVVLGLLLLSGLVGYFLARQFSVPLQNLVLVADSLAKGNMEMRADESATGELGLFARAFNRMADKLQAFQRSLEERVEQRTAELVQSIATLRIKDAAIETSINAIGIVGLNGRITYVNRAFVDLWQLQGPEDAVGRATLEFADQPEDIQAVIDCLQQHGSWQGELRAQRHDGSLVDLQLSGHMVKNAVGQPVCMMISFSDVTQRKFAEQALQKSEALLESIIAGMPAMVFVKRASDLSFERLNRAGEALMGFSEQELLGKNDYDFFPREQADSFTASDREVLASHQVRDIAQESIRIRNGETRVLHTRKIGIYNAAGEPTHLLGVSVDITEQKLAEAALQRERDFASSLLDAAPAIVMLLDHRGAIRKVNRYFEQLSGYKPEEIVGKEWLTTFVPEREQAVICTLLHAVLHRAKMSGNVSCIVTRNGNERAIEWSTQPIYDNHGEVSDMLCIGQDVTERIANEQLLRISAERLNEAQHIAQLGSWELDLVRGKLAWSDEVFNLFEIDQRQFGATYEAFLNAIHPDDREAVNQAYTRSLEIRAPYEIVHRLRMSDGRIKWVHERCSSEFSADGKPLRSVGTVQDITERKQHEVELQRFNEELEQRVAQRTAQLLAAKEEAELASKSKSLFLTSMSHELRTPLNAILGYAQLMQLNTELPEYVIADANEIKRAGDDLLTLLNDVLDLARIESGRMEIQIESFALSEVLAECHRQNLQAADAHNIRLLDEGSCGSVHVRADRRCILQVLNNLVSNAIKYNRDGGRVSISCRAAGNGRIRMAVSDTGSGIAPEMQAQLFQPFSRLGAEMGAIQGAGVGLAISRRLMEAMDGCIGVDSVQGEGSTFWVELPTLEQVAPRHGLEAGLQTAGSMPRVLVAEDYVPNQNLLRMQLQALGCEVEIACDGAEALNKYRAGHYDLILTDLNMPVMDGTALAIAIRQDEASRGGHIPIIAITAAAVASELKRCREAGMDDTLTKPLALGGLQAALKRWLGAAVVTVAFDKKGAPAGNGDAILNLECLYDAIGQVNLAEARSLIATFIGSAGEGLNQLAFNMGDGVAVSREMHKQKSSALTVGALRYAQLADMLEQRTKSGDTADLASSLAALRDALADIELAALELHKFAVKNQPAVIDATALNCHSALVVDDDPVVLQQIAGMLATLGVPQVLVAKNGVEAIRVLAARGGKVEVLLCDLNMPEMDGVELIREVGRSGFDGGVILISGEDEKVLNTVSRLAELQGLRVLGQLRKPVVPVQLIPLLAGSAAVPRQKPLVAPTVSSDAIRAGIAANEFSIWFQPKVDSAGLRAHGVEALARWKLPDGSFVPPDIFIVAAEQQGLIGELSQRLLAMALTEGAKLFAAGFPLEIAVNLSGLWLTDLNLPDFIFAQTLAAQLKVDNVILEVTETGVMEDVATALDVLTRLRLKGFGLSIDDFGIGYSSFEQLSRIPFTEMKLDRSFVSGANQDAAARAILEGSMDMARKLGLSTVAEGVETEHDLELVRTLGCERVQGYLIAKPMPVDELITWLRNAEQTGVKS